MNPEPDHAIREIEASRPKLRDGLRMAFREYAGKPGWIIEEPYSGRFFRVGESERRFLDQLDGSRTVGEIIARLAASEDGLNLEPGQATSLVRVLTDNGLLATRGGAHAERLRGDLSEDRSTSKILGAASSALFLKLPLCNPDRFFRWLARSFGWLASPAFAVVWLIVVAWGISAVYGDWLRFRDQLSGVFQVGNLWLLGGLWIALKAFHECWHGLMCRKFGGAVPEGGVSLLLFVTPLGYVDASSSTGFPLKGQRMFVAAAGMYGEIFLAAIAALVWARMEPGLMSSALHQVIVLSSVTTLLFNANPLMRFDGYYLLADWLDIPNLAKRGQTMFGWLVRRWLLGIRGAKFPLRHGERAVVIGTYGVLAAMWKLTVMIGLLVAAAHLFHGIGLIVTIVAAIGIVGSTLLGWIRYFTGGAMAEGVSWWKTGLRCAVIVAILVAILATIQIAPSSKAPAVVRSTAGGEVRAHCPGFLTEIVAPPGTWVEAGDVILRLENLEQKAAYQKARIEVERSRLRLNSYHASEEIAAFQAEKENLSAWEQKASELKEWTQSLEVTAPVPGQVMGRPLDSVMGNWIGRGEMLFAIGDPDNQELLILLAQDEVSAFQEDITASRAVDFLPRGSLHRAAAEITSVTPTAILKSPHAALTVPGGGPLGVRRADGSVSSGDSYSLLKPHIEIRADLQNDDAVPLREGEIGWVKIRSAEKRSLLESTSNWLDGQFQRLFESPATR